MSREKILNAIAKNKPAPLPLPEKFIVERTLVNLAEKFLDVLQGIGGKGRIVNDLTEVKNLLQEKRERGVEVVNCIKDLPGYNAGDYVSKTAAETQTVHTVFLKGVIAVAENAAIWVPESAAVNRILPFICQELVMVVDERDLVANMHEAYDLINVNEDGYGAFIAGPSKTADIEQSLVIGAHGPLKLDVFVVRS